MATTWMLYDGGCGVCHAGVRFVAERDARAAVRFAPLGGPTHARLLGPADADRPQGSVVVVAPDGRVHRRSDAVAVLLGQLAGPWPTVGRLLRCVPHPIRNAAYDLVARCRTRLARRPNAVCPVLAPDQRARFAP